MLVFNWIGFGMLMLWVGFLTVTMKVTGERSQVLLGMLLGAIVVIIIDIVLRLVYMRSNAARLPILHPKTGGHLFFIPI